MVHLFNSINWAHELPHTVKVPGIQRLKHDANPQPSHHAEKGVTWVNKQAPCPGEASEAPGRGNSTEKGRERKMRKEFVNEVSQDLKRK